MSRPGPLGAASLEGELVRAALPSCLPLPISRGICEMEGRTRRNVPSEQIPTPIEALIPAPPMTSGDAPRGFLPRLPAPVFGLRPLWQFSAFAFISPSCTARISSGQWRLRWLWLCKNQRDRVLTSYASSSKIVDEDRASSDRERPNALFVSGQSRCSIFQLP